MKAKTEACMKRRGFLKGSALAAITIYFWMPSDNMAAENGMLPKSLKQSPSLSSWIKIDQNNLVTVFTGKVELGQGIRTALAQIVSDELGIALNRIRVLSAETTTSPDEGYTYGSLSIQQSGQALRLVAAELNYILRERAAKDWAVDIKKVTACEGYLRIDGRLISYGALIKQTGNIEARASGRIEPKRPGDRGVAGQSVRRADIAAKVFGEEIYIHDLRLPNMLHARMVRPPFPEAHIEGGELPPFDYDGVEKVIHRNAFIAVVASREECAINAAESLAGKISWQGESKLPALEKSFRYLHNHPDGRRLLVKATLAADLQPDLSAHYFRPFQAHASISPSIGVALWQDDRLTVWTHSQGIYPLRREIAAVLKLPIEKIKLIHRDGAGCYGHNGADDAALEAAVIAMNVPGRPIRLQWMRQEEFLHEPYGSAMAIEVAAKLSAEGMISGWSFDVSGFPHSTRPDGSGNKLLAARYLGVSGDRSEAHPIPQPAGGLDRNALPYYDIPALKIQKNFIPDGPLRTSALRGLGAYGNIFAIESFMDELAIHSGQDPVQFRLRHLSDPRAREVVEAAAELCSWKAKKVPPDGRGGGRGFAFARYKNMGGYLAVCVDLDVDNAGQIQLREVNAAVDCGEVINPDGVRNQVEGGLIQSASWTLMEQVFFDSERVLSEDWAGYPILTFDRIPKINIHIVNRPHQPPLGAGEVAQGPMAAAIGNAVYQALGARLRFLPLEAEIGSKHRRE